MVAPPPAFTIRHPDYPMPDNITPFRDYDIMGPLWDPVPFFSSNQRAEEWTTNQLISLEQLEEYGAYYVGDRSDMYTVSHFVYHQKGHYMPVFRKISGYDMFTDYRRLRILRNRNRPRPFSARSVCLNPPPPAHAAAPTPNSQGQQPKRLDIFMNTEGFQITPKPDGSSSSAQPINNGNDYMEEGGGIGNDHDQEQEPDAMRVDDEAEELGNCFWDELIEDYFSDRASSITECTGFDGKW